VEDTLCQISLDQSLNDVPKKQKLKPIKSLDYYLSEYKIRNEAMAKAYLSGHYTLEKVGEHFGVSYATVSRAVKKIENKASNVKYKAPILDGKFKFRRSKIRKTA